MDTNKRKTGLARLIEIAGTKRRLLIGAMLLAVITAIVQFVPIIAVYNILIELAEHALDPSLIDKAYIWLWSYIALGAFFAFGVLTFASPMLSHIAAFNILYEIRMQLVQKMVRLPLGFFSRRASGELKKIMSDDVERIELFIAHHIPDIVTATFSADSRQLYVCRRLAVGYRSIGCAGDGILCDGKNVHRQKNPGGFQTVCGDLRQNEC